MNSSETDQLVAELSTEINPQTFVKEIKQTELPPVLREFSQRCVEEEISNRGIFIWKWLYQAFGHFQLETVPKEKSEEARIIKTLYSMYITNLDDVAEETQDRATFEQARTIPSPITSKNSLEEVDQSIVSFEEDIWDRLIKELLGTPRYEQLKNIFRYDTRQSTIALEYSLLVGEHTRKSINIILEDELIQDETHNLSFLGFLDIDLMFSPEFDMEDINSIREIYWDAEQMARIGNWVTTWEREVHEGDYTSGVIARALRKGITSIEQLENHPAAAIKVIEDSTIEADFIEEWKELHTKIQAVDNTASSIDLSRVADRMEVVLSFQLAAEGYK